MENIPFRLIIYRFLGWFSKLEQNGRDAVVNPEHEETKLNPLICSGSPSEVTGKTNDHLLKIDFRIFK